MRVLLNMFLGLLLTTSSGICFYISLPVESAEKVIYVPKGSPAQIISHLNSLGYRLNKIDRYILTLIGKPQMGWIEVASEIQSKGKFLHTLACSKAATHSVTLIPGETVYFFLRQVSSKLNIALHELEYQYKSLAQYEDGVILANTYKIPYDAKASYVIKYLVDLSMREHEKMSVKFLGSYNPEEWFKYISKASIIQKEAANTEEMPIISGVIDNRIAARMPLQMDGSLNYGEFSHSRVTPKRIREDKSKYNTYRYTGIPKDPVGSVSLQAIESAIYPAKVPYLFFVKNSDGTHDFTTSYSEHLKMIKSSGKKTKKRVK